MIREGLEIARHTLPSGFAGPTSIVLPRLTSLGSACKVKLHVMGPTCTPQLWNEPAETVSAALGQEEPFYPFLWPGGYALSEYIACYPSALAPGAVLDFGAGCGVAGLAAALHAGRSAWLVDIDGHALAASHVNAAANGVQHKVTLSSHNFLDPTTAQLPSEVGTVLVADVFYDEAFTAATMAFLRTCAASGKDVLVADPGRHALPSAARAALHGKVDGAEGEEEWHHEFTCDLPPDVAAMSNGFSQCHVWRLQHSGHGR